MTTGLVALVVGSAAGIVCGLTARAALVARAARLYAVFTPLALLFATIFLACATAWTFFTEYVGTTAWWWFAAGSAAGLAIGEGAVRSGRRRGTEVDAQPPDLHSPKQALTRRRRPAAPPP